MTTPTPPEEPGYDTLPWPKDALAVWIESDEPARDTVRQAMPELGRALDRQAGEVMGSHRRRPHWVPERRRSVPWQEGTSR